jgi:hypothetical protein
MPEEAYNRPYTSVKSAPGLCNHQPAPIEETTESSPRLPGPSQPDTEDIPGLVQKGSTQTGNEQEDIFKDIVKDIFEGGQDQDRRRKGRLKKSAQQEVEGGVTGFFKSLFRGVGKLLKVSALSLFSGILGAALLPFFGPVAAIGVSLGLGAAVIEIQENLKPLGLGLQDETIRKLAEPLQGKQPDERELRKVIEEVLSEDRQANEDLAKAFSKLLPTINKAAAATNIEFSGPIQGLTIGEHNRVTQTFEDFLHEKL